MLRKIIDWLEDRTGVESAVHHFLYENIPASAGWHQVLGSVAMFARYVRTIRIADGVAVMFTTLAFFLMVVVLMLAVIGDALWGYFQGR